MRRGETRWWWDLNKVVRRKKRRNGAREKEKRGKGYERRDKKEKKGDRRKRDTYVHVLDLHTPLRMHMYMCMYTHLNVASLFLKRKQ